MPTILKYSQDLVATQYTLNSCTYNPHLRTRLNILSINGTFSTMQFMTEVYFCLVSVRTRNQHIVCVAATELQMGH